MAYAKGHSGPKLGRVQLIRRPSNATRSMGLPLGNGAYGSNSNSNWEQPAYVNPILTDSMGQGNWSHKDMQWNTHNAGTNTQPIVEHVA